MQTELTMRAVMFSGKGSQFPDMPCHYDVDGLLSDQSALITKHADHWEILRNENGVYGESIGRYETSEAALKSLQQESALR